MLVERADVLTDEQKEGIKQRLGVLRSQRRAIFEEVDREVAKDFGVTEGQVERVRQQIGYHRTAMYKDKLAFVKNLFLDNPGITNENIQDVLKEKFGAGIILDALTKMRKLHGDRAHPGIAVTSSAGFGMKLHYMSVDGAAKYTDTTVANIRWAMRVGHLKPDLHVDESPVFLKSTIDAWRKKVSDGRKQQGLAAMAKRTASPDQSRLLSVLERLEQRVDALDRKLSEKPVVGARPNGEDAAETPPPAVDA